jgi:hypothetical protein
MASRATVAATTANASPTAGGRNPVQPQFRYPAVFALMLAAVVFVIGAPDGHWSRAVAIGIEGCALVLTVATSRERRSVRRRRAITLGLTMIVAVIVIGLGQFPTLSAAAAIFATAGVPVALARGLLRLMHLHGVTFQAVAGALAIYLSTGLVFAWIVGFVVQVSNTPYFAQHTSGTLGDKVYFSFTVLTTTGFGDFSPATPAGHALAVIEMLIGQLYLVTVIGLLIGNYAGRRPAD